MHTHPTDIANTLFLFCQRWEWGLAVGIREYSFGLATLPLIQNHAVTGVQPTSSTMGGAMTLPETPVLPSDLFNPFHLLHPNSRASQRVVCDDTPLLLLGPPHSASSAKCFPPDATSDSSMFSFSLYFVCLSVIWLFVCL